MARETFEAVVEPSGRGGGHLAHVPDDVVAALGGKGRIAVRAAFDGIPYRGSIVRMGGAWVLGVQKAILAEAGVSAGGTLTVVVENDEQPREVEVPEELAAALRKSPRAKAAWDKLSYSHRREYVGHITEAKKPETRERRVQRTIGALQERSG
jgi:hypothetical protein